MGSHSPGRFRKMGREAYIPDETNPEYHFNYPKTSWYYQTHYASFLEGWEEGKAAYNKAMENDANAEENIPWINLDEVSWERIKKAAKRSPWMPEEYAMDDWVSDVIDFLQNEREE